MAGKGGGAWKVAYADFVTAMMAFFMVMWLVSQNNSAKSAVAEYFRDPSGSKNQSGGGAGKGTSTVLLPGKSDKPGSPERVVEKRFGNTQIKIRGRGGRIANAGTGYAAVRPPNESKLRVVDPSLFVLHGGAVHRVGTVVLFPEESAELDAASKQLLDELALPLSGKRNKIEIRGHASRRPLPHGSPYKDSWELSYARCQAAIQYLISKGISADRFRLCQAGGFEPYSKAVDKPSLAKNSRVEIFMLGEMVEDLEGSPDAAPGKSEKHDKHSDAHGSDSHGGNHGHH